MTSSVKTPSAQTGTLGIGVDFGTSNSAAAVFDGEEVRFATLEQDADIMPSALYLDRDLQRLTGQGAIDRYVKENTGRTVELIPEVIGESSVLVGGAPGGGAPPETLTTKVYGQATTDAGLQGRLFRGTKRLLGDPNVRRLMVFDHPFRLVALVTPILLHINQGVKALSGAGAANRATIGHPVNFEGRDSHKTVWRLPAWRSPTSTPDLKPRLFIQSQLQRLLVTCIRILLPILRTC